MTNKETKLTEVERKLEEIAECSICYSTFKEPKILPCIHTFCMECLRQTGLKSGKKLGDKMPCPICRKKFVIPETGYNGLQKNVLIERMIEVKQILKPSYGSILCDECVAMNESDSDAKISTAEVFCSDCHLKLCNECHKRHAKSKLSKHHKIIGLEEEEVKKNSFSQNICIRFCDEHKQNPLELYCLDCQTVVCAVCFVENHKGHDGSDVNKVSSGFRQAIETKLDSLSSVMTKLEENRNQLERSEATLKSNAEEIAVKVNRRRNELKELVDKDADDLLQKLESVKHQNLKEIEIKKEDIETRIITIDSFKSYCRQINANGSPEDVYREMKILLNKATELKKSHTSANEKELSLSVLSLKESTLAIRLLSGVNIIGEIEGFNNAQELMRDSKTETASLNAEASGKDIKQHERTIQDPVVGRVKPTYEPGNTNCDRGLQFHSALKTRNSGITGIAILQNELFVMFDDSRTEVYDVQMLKFKREFHVKGLKFARDMKQCQAHNCLYIITLNCGRDEIIKVDLVGQIINRFPVDTTGLLSVTQESNILLISSVSSPTRSLVKGVKILRNILREYTSDGDLIHSIPIGLDSGIRFAWHALKLNYCYYAICHETEKVPCRRISLVNSNGIVLGYYGGEWNGMQLNYPCYLDIDGNGNILVADQENSRVLVLSSDLNVRFELPISTDRLFEEKPTKIMFDPSCGCLFVAVSKLEKASRLNSGDEVKMFKIADCK